MVPLLAIVAILLGVSGFAELTQATLGVGLLCAGCLLAIVARLVQADQQAKRPHA